jgi:hypothetical protein
MDIIKKIMDEQMGFIVDDNQLLQIIAIDPNYEVLIRANLYRKVVPASQVVIAVKKINDEKHNHVRDISIGFTKIG